MDNEAVATEPELELSAPPRYSLIKAVAALALLPLLVWIVTRGVVELFYSLGWTISSGLGFILTSSGFILSALIFILVTGQIKKTLTVLRLKNFRWYYPLVGLGAAIFTYMVALLVGLIAIYISKLGGAPKMGTNTTSKTIGEISQHSSFLFPIFIVTILAPIGEEIFFRGALLGSLVQESKKTWIRVISILVVSVIFGSYHFQGVTGTLADFTAVIIPGLVGVMAAILTVRFNSLYPGIFTHLFYNGIVLLLLSGALG